MTNTEPRDIAYRFNVTVVTAYAWRKSTVQRIVRRVEAAQSASRETFDTPEQGFVKWLTQTYGINCTDVARFYGYHRDTVYKWLRDPEKRYNRRIWTMIDYYLTVGV